MRSQRVAVVGTGSWGTAMASICHAGGIPVILWGRDPDKVARLHEERRHPDLINGQLSPDLPITADTTALHDADLIFWAVPTQHTRVMARQLEPDLPPQAGIVSLTKGLEQETLVTPTRILHEVLGDRPVACLSGPSHAEEVIQGLPAGLAAAGDDELVRLLVELLHNGQLRVYVSQDLAGLELGAALKNVIAIAAGACVGLRLGDNALALLVTRGLAEIRRLGRFLGADDATFAGLAGIGDLLTTCYSPHGRNRALGVAIGKGDAPQQYLHAQHMVCEGAWTCRAAVSLGQRHGCELPIASQVESVLWRDKEVKQAIGDLLSRSAKEENA